MENRENVKTLHWHRRPGFFVFPETGKVIPSSVSGMFHGTPREWYETLGEVTSKLVRSVGQDPAPDGRRFRDGIDAGLLRLHVGEDALCFYEDSVLYHPTQWRRNCGTLKVRDGLLEVVEDRRIAPLAVELRHHLTQELLGRIEVHSSHVMFEDPK